MTWGRLRDTGEGDSLLVDVWSSLLHEQPWHWTRLGPLTTVPSVPSSTKWGQQDLPAQVSARSCRTDYRAGPDSQVACN